MAEKKEPQSYGSQDDWVSGRTGQKVNHADSFHEEKSSVPHQGGNVSPVQASEHAMPSGPPTDDGRKVSARRAARSGVGTSRRGITRGKSRGLPLDYCP